MTVIFRGDAYKYSIHATNGFNPIMGRAYPVISDDNIEYFEGWLIETTRDARTGEIEEMELAGLTAKLKEE